MRVKGRLAEYFDSPKHEVGVQQLRKSGRCVETSLHPIQELRTGEEKEEVLTFRNAGKLERLFIFKTIVFFIPNLLVKGLSA